MSRQMKKMLIIVSIVFGIVFGFYGLKKILIMWGMAHYVPPPVTVSSSTASAKTWQSYLTSVGTLSAINGVEVSSEAPGIVTEIRFASGQNVNRGDILVLLDSTVENAKLKNDSAKLKLAQINYQRDEVLIQKKVISQAATDADLAQLQEAEAQVEGDQALIKQKTITAPFTGTIGIRLINIGQYLQAGTPIVSLQALDPLYVQFNLPEQNLSDLYLQQVIDASVNLSGDKTVPGTMTAINSKVDPVTRNILIQATIANKNLALRPGMFAQIKVWLRAKKNVIILPETAISYSLHGDSVFVIKAEGKDHDDKPILNAYRRYVKVGDKRGESVAIIDGIQPGEQVVTAGQLKLQNGTRVVINNQV